MYKSFLYCALIFFSAFVYADESKWKTINQSDSKITINSKIVKHKVVDSLPKYESLVKWANRKKSAGEYGYFVSYWSDRNENTKQCDSICFSISYYEVEKSTWIADIHARYSPRHSIKYFYDGVGKKGKDYSFTSKLKTFKSIRSWFNYRLFIDKKTEQNCFIFGTQWHHGFEFPYAVLDGVFCKSNKFNKNDFTEKEIKNIIVNIGVKKLREVPNQPYFKAKEIKVSKELKKQIINKIIGNYEGVLIYNNNDKLPVMTQIYLNESNNLRGSYAFKDFGGEILKGKLSNFKIKSKNKLSIEWRDSYGRGWLDINLSNNEFKGSWGVKNNNTIEKIGEWNGVKIQDTKNNNIDDDDTYNKLKKLKKLFEDGLITEDEYNLKRKELEHEV